MQDYRYFHCLADDPWRQFSTQFASDIHLLPEHVTEMMTDLCPLLVTWLGQDGCVFPSAQHLWEALKAKDKRTFHAFTTEGRFADMVDFFETYYHDLAKLNCSEWLDKVESECRFWHDKKMIGVMARLAGKRTNGERLHLGVTKMNYWFDFMSELQEVHIWSVILFLKFSQNEVLREALLATGSCTLVEYEKSKAKHWSRTGRVRLSSGLPVTGRNIVGRCLMEVRNKLASDVMLLDD